MEWMQDCWHESYVGAPADGTAWSSEDSRRRGLRVIRGGSWDAYPSALRAAFRGWSDAAGRRSTVGFRVARTLT
jgi:formylglycine-generating enzyme required for sulfatase activity